MHLLLKFVWFNNFLALWFQNMWEEKWRIFPSPDVCFIAWILALDPSEWLFELHFDCLSSSVSERWCGQTTLGRKLLLRNPMYLAALAFLVLNFWSCFLFRSLHKLNKHFFQLPALLMSVGNAIFRRYSLLKLTRATLGLQWQPARSLRASPVPEWGEINSTTQAALHHGEQEHVTGFHESLDPSSRS